MQVLADENVPTEYVSALRGDGHDVVFTRDVTELGPETNDESITEYAESEGFAILSTDVKDFGGREASVPILVAPQDMSGGEVRDAVATIERIDFDPSETDAIWLSAL